MPALSARRLVLAGGFALALLASPGCSNDPTDAVVTNAYPVAGDPAETMTVFKVWWVTTLFPNPVAPGAASEIERTVPGRDFAYALLAPGWSPGDGPRPPRLVALRSGRPFFAAANDLLTITVDDSRFVGDCAAGSTLADPDAQLIVERIFPGDFAGEVYDPATCTSAPAAPDAGIDATAD